MKNENKSKRRNIELHLLRKETVPKTLKTLSPSLLSRMVHDSCKAEAVALPPCDGVRPLSWVHTVLIPSSGHRSNMMYADQSGLLL